MQGCHVRSANVRVFALSPFGCLPVNTVVKKNTIVLNVPLSHSIVLAEAQGVMQRDLVVNLASGGATAHDEQNDEGKDEVNGGR